MTARRAFDRAISQWEVTRRTATDDDYAALESAEKVVLSHRPTSLEDAASMLEVVIEQRGDGRSDGLDLRALERIVVLLRDAACVSRPRALATASAAAFEGRGA